MREEFPIDEHEKEEFIPRTKLVIDEYPVIFDIKGGEEANEEENNERSIPQARDLLYDSISRKIRAENTEKEGICNDIVTSKSDVAMKWVTTILCILAMLGIICIFLKVNKL